MREERPATRDFPDKPVTQRSGVERYQQESVLPGEMLRGRFLDLIGGRQMDEAIGQIDGGTFEYAVLLSRSQSASGQS